MTPILLDTAVVIIILLSTLVALFRGFIKEALTIVNLGAAAAAAYLFGPVLVPTFKGWLGVTGTAAKKSQYIWGVIPPEVAALFLSYGAAFFGVFIILSLAGMAISSGAKAMGLGPADRFLGIIFGLTRGALLVFLIYLPFGFFMQPSEFPAWAKDSISVSLLDSSYRYADNYMRREGNHATASAAAEESETPADPDSMKGKLQRMADEALEKKSNFSFDGRDKKLKEIMGDDYEEKH